VLRLLVLVGVVFAAVGIVRTEARGAFAAAAAGLLALALLMPGERALWLRRHGLTGGEALVAEDATGVVALTPREIGGWRVWVNGRSHSTLPFGGIHTALGAAPALMHPAPRDVAVIGLGSGDTARAAGCRYSLEFFMLCARGLKPGGALCTWAPTTRMRRTFLRAMPHVLELMAEDINRDLVPRDEFNRP
jgi:hypothetical protein